MCRTDTALPIFVSRRAGLTTTHFWLLFRRQQSLLRSTDIPFLIQVVRPKVDGRVTPQEVTEWKTSKSKGKIKGPGKSQSQSDSSGATTAKIIQKSRQSRASGEERDRGVINLDLDILVDKFVLVCLLFLSSPSIIQFIKIRLSYKDDAMALHLLR